MVETPAARADALKRRFAFDRWPRRSAAGALFIWNMALADDTVPGMTIVRAKTIDADAAIGPRSRPKELHDASVHAPRLHVQSLWRYAVPSDVLMRVDVFECTSETDAREKALWLLGEFESPLVEPAQGVGDVAFASRGEGLILFVRANLVCLLRNIERRGHGVRRAALALDAAAVGTHRLRQCSLKVSKPRPTRGTGDRAVEATLELADGDGIEGNVPRKFVAPDGEIELRGGAVVFTGPRAALGQVAAYEWGGRR